MKIAVNGSHPIVVSKLKSATGIGFTLMNSIIESEQPEELVANKDTS